MENFVVSARKYRPAAFNTVVGQGAITTTLKNSLQKHHLAQAFLFCGPRGVGKTTCARILAKTINCLNLTPETEACDQCESCTSFNNGNSLNIFELDAASNNSVDDIRHLIDQVRFAPHLGKYKVYIIDEVHMLSTSAFNAFLKTLEEPPAHAVFILATTEKHKIIPTILSRCQIFDFSRIQIKDIAGHLAMIAANEGITAEPEALHIIGQKADGALRDALSMFDQIVSFAGTNLTYKAVIENLNVLDYDYYFRLTDHFLKAEIPDSLLLYNEILEKGFDGHNFINGLAGHFRSLMMCRYPGTLKLLDVSENVIAKYSQQAQACSESFLLDALKLTEKCDLSYKISKSQRLLVEFTLMQLCSITSQKKSPDEPIEIIGPARMKRDPNASSTATNESVPVQNQTKSAAPPPPPVPPPAARPAPIPVSTQKPGDFKTKTLSVSQMLRKKQNDEQADGAPIRQSELPKTPFTFEELLPVWKEYATGVKQQGKNSLYTLLARDPKLSDETTIHLILDNKALEEDLNSEKPDLLGFLRKRLNNAFIEITQEVSLTPTTTRLYTNRDKFARMVEINPLLKKLRDTLDLEIE